MSALRLFRGHVAGRAQNGFGPGQAAVEVENLGQAEVGELGRAVGRQEDVRRLEVAVDHAVAVRLLDAASQQLDEPGGLAGRPATAVEPGGEIAAVEVFQDEIRVPVLIAQAVNLDDVGVMEPGDRLAFGAETGHRHGGAVAPEDHLERDGAIQRHLTRLVHDPHPAPADLRLDLEPLRRGPRADGRVAQNRPGTASGRRAAALDIRVQDRALLNRAVHRDLDAEPLGVAGEPPEELGEGRGLAQIVTQGELRVSQLEGPVTVGLKRRVEPEIGFGRDELAVSPLPELIGARQFDHVGGGEALGAGELIADVPVAAAAAGGGQRRTVPRLVLKAHDTPRPGWASNRGRRPGSHDRLVE